MSHQLETGLNVRRCLKFVFPFLLSILPAIALAGQFKVVRVYDGDTLTARGHDIDIKVRLVGIDAPKTSKNKKRPG